MNFKKLWRFLLKISKFKSWERILLRILNFENLIFQKMQFSLLSLGNFKSEFENEISPDAVNFGRFATNRRDLDFKKLWRFLLRISKFKKALEISPENFKIQKLGENFKNQKLGENFEFQKALENSPENFEIQKLWRILLRISKFKSWERILNFKKLWRFLQ